jgi:hypothetical protein
MLSVPGTVCRVLSFAIRVARAAAIVLAVLAAIFPAIFATVFTSVLPAILSAILSAIFAAILPARGLIRLAGRCGGGEQGAGDEQRSTQL